MRKSEVEIGRTYVIGVQKINLPRSARVGDGWLTEKGVCVSKSKTKSELTFEVTKLQPDIAPDWEGSRQFLAGDYKNKEVTRRYTVPARNVRCEVATAGML